MSRTVRFDPLDIQAEFRKALDDFIDPFTTDRARNSLGKAHLPGLRERIAEARARLDKDFVLMVLGDFKRGKSTLINALLEQEILSSDVTPETVSINQVTWGSSLDVEAVLTNGGRVSLEHGELSSERLVRVMRELPAPVDHLQIRAPAAWLRGLRIVDTPGLGDLMQRFDAQVRSFLPVADAVVYVISALSPLSESERAFLQAHIRPQGYPKLLFVVNMLDTLPSEADAERLLESVRTKIHADFPGAMVMGLSALDELCRVSDLPRPEPERGEQLAVRFAELRGHLQTSVLLNRELLHVARSLGHATAVMREQDVALRRLVNALASSQEALDAAIMEREDEHSALHEQIRGKKQAIKRMIEGLANESVRWMDGFLDRLRDQGVSKLNTIPYGDVQRYFPFYFTERVREALVRCFDAHQPMILAELEKAGDDLVRVMSEGPTSLDRKIAGASFETTKWSFVDNFYLLGPLGGVARFVFVDGLGRLFGSTAASKSEPTGRSARFQQQVEAAFPEIRRTAAEEIKGLYRDLARKIDLELDGWYRAEVDATLQALRQAREIHAAKQVEGSSVEAFLQELLGHVEHHEELLGHLGEKLEQSSVVETALS